MIEYKTRGSVSLPTVLSDVVGARELIWQLCVRDVTTTYRQSLLGVVWVILTPLTIVALFTALSASKVLSISDTTLPYPVHVLLGLTVWGVFASVLQATTTSLTRAANLIQKTRFPREALVLAALGPALLDVGIRAALLVGLAAFYRVPFRWEMLLVPLAVAPLLLLTVGAGLILSIANALVRDVGNGLGIVLQFAMFLTPVVYPRPTTWPHVLLNYLNPVSPFVIAAQDLVTTGDMSMPTAWMMACVLSGLALLVGLYVFRVAQPLIAERM